MRSLLPKSPISPGWWFLAVCLVSLCMCNMLASLGGEAVLIAPVTATKTLVAMNFSRAGVAPPATRPGFTIATPLFIGSVPTARTANFDAQQIDYGRNTFAQWCATCHGDHGQGLDLWRSSWDPDHQTCSKAGCHGYRHPPDGFLMVKVAPPLIGGDSLAKFQNTFQLFAYIRGAMPYQAPGTLGDDQYWAVTAYLADQHGADALRKPLNEANALTVVLPAAKEVGEPRAQGSRN